MSNKRFKLNDGEIYKYNKENGFSIFDPFSFTYNGYTIKKLYELNENRKEVLNKLIAYETALKKKYSDAQGKSLFDILDNLLDNNKLHIFDLEKDYNAFDTNTHGYIKNALEGKLTPKKVTLPQDLLNGSYKLEKGKIIHDKRREEELWNL